MFTRAESLPAFAAHLLYLARLYEKLNALVKAHETYIKIMNEDVPPSVLSRYAAPRRTP